MTFSLKQIGPKRIENKAYINFKGSAKPPKELNKNTGSSSTQGEPVLGMYKNLTKMELRQKDKTPEENALYTNSKLNSSGRKTTQKDFKNLQIIFSKNEDASHFADKVLEARDKGFEVKDVLSLLYILSKDFEDDFDFLLEYDNGSLSTREIMLNIQAARNTDNPEEYSRLRKIFNIVDTKEFLNNGGFLSQHGLVERFDEINEILFGSKPEELTKREEEFKNQYGVNVHLDYNVSAANIDEIENHMQRITDSGMVLPEHIYITEFFDKSAAGIFSPKHPDSLFITPYESDSRHKENTLLHEFVHLNDFAVKKEEYEHLPIDKNLANILHRYVSRYSSTNSNEFIAEVGTLMLQGIIKIDEEAENILIKKEYINEDNKPIEPKAAEVSAMMKSYFSLGGQLFNTPSILVDDSYMKVALEL